MTTTLATLLSCSITSDAHNRISWGSDPMIAGETSEEDWNDVKAALRAAGVNVEIDEDGRMVAE